MDDHSGHALAGQALVNEAGSRLHPSGFDPSCEVEPLGTFACPICGEDRPHHHGPSVVDAYQNKRSRK